ncbi:uncharacterized protein HMPREF1541_08026 [Cyphellophora europaea CBS 101466]|uniref:Xylanolytic transcriptional activator regulatory domain-containing protein n=1 Tax=Cyphellophora europaea (strain CBS 101466) TaxID=1220924 RepID=W2RKM2_CYPE1|nr:uncharacterized protein HMPREF1541_08026 [Cyphellophora europaea CBS 101466]ETN37037.1 hypothetical protein HMPREF1541_08026 [Cyphellophora europaea CBS 101466]
MWPSLRAPAAIVCKTGRSAESMVVGRQLSADETYLPTPSAGPSTAPSLRNDIQVEGNQSDSTSATRTHPDLPQQKFAQGPDKASGPDPIVVPHYVGESEGLEFLFDVCSPSRPFKGNIYLIGRQRSKFPDDNTVKALKSQPLPSDNICHELLRDYFSYVHPFLPIINAAEFLNTYHNDRDRLSSLLLRSVLFAAASFVSSGPLQKAGFSTRKALKEHLYSQAKVGGLHFHFPLAKANNAVATSAILLAHYYIDLEDLDGPWHWIGIALSLCHTMGLHRDPRWDRLQRSPFPNAQYALWRRIWWCCYYRDAWLALAIGRPMRINSDHCDAPIPTTDDVLTEIEQLSPELRRTFVAHEMPALTGLWINFLHLSELVEVVLATNHRLKRPPVTRSRLEHLDREIWTCYEKIYDLQGQPSRLQSLHTHLLRAYYNSVIVALFRPYIHTANVVGKSEQEGLRTLAIDRCRAAASNTTYSLNELVSSDLVDVAPNMLITAMMSAMQIHFYEYCRLDGLASHHALHNLKLHIMVLDHLRKTWWTADMQHKLFLEALKALESAPKGPHETIQSKEPQVHSRQSDTPRQRSVEEIAGDEGTHQQYDLESDITNEPILGNNDNTLDEFFGPFNPFNFSAIDRSFFGNAGDWGFGNGVV